MKAYVTEKGRGKTALLLTKALYSASENSSDTICVICSNQKRSALLKKRAIDIVGSDLPKNIEFIGADSFFARGESRVKRRNTTRFFFDDIDDSLKAMCEKIVNGKVVMEMATATDDAK